MPKHCIAKIKKKNTKTNTNKRVMAVKVNDKANKHEECACRSYPTNPLHVDMLIKYAGLYLDKNKNSGGIKEEPSWEGHLTAIRMYSRFHTLIVANDAAMQAYIKDTMLVALSPLIAVVLAAKLTDSDTTLKLKQDKELQNAFCTLVHGANFTFKRSISPHEMSQIFKHKSVAFLNAIGHLCLPVSKMALDEIMIFVDQHVKCNKDSDRCWFSGIVTELNNLRERLLSIDTEDQLYKAVKKNKLAFNALESFKGMFGFSDFYGI